MSVMELFSTREVAALLGVSDETIRTLIIKGALPGERLSDTSWWRVRKDRLIEYAEQRRVTIDLSARQVTQIKKDGNPAHFSK